MRPNGCYFLSTFWKKILSEVIYYFVFPLKCMKVLNLWLLKVKPKLLSIKVVFIFIKNTKETIKEIKIRTNNHRPPAAVLYINLHFVIIQFLWNISIQQTYPRLNYTHYTMNNTSFSYFIYRPRFRVVLWFF